MSVASRRVFWAIPVACFGRLGGFAVCDDGGRKKLTILSRRKKLFVRCIFPVERGRRPGCTLSDDMPF